ncbi:MAG: EndoU domain-containing protein, partial [Actinomycetota bacterium]|nr:EndoU domain-containing protein [Actinomycetota bacterium]
QVLLHDARARVQHQAGVAAAVLAAAEEAAPKEPGLLRQILDGGGGLFTGFFGDGLGGVIRAAWESVDALLDDPGAWVKDTWDDLYDHVAVWNWDTFSSTWVEFGKEFVAWDQWAKDWKRALGQVAFNVVFTVATGGAGKGVLRLLKRRKLSTPTPKPREHHQPHSSSPAENRRHYARPPGAPPYEKVHRTARSNRHILDGETYRRGGHRARTGYPGKTEFPDGWSDEQILDTVDEAAQNPVRYTELKMTEPSPKHPAGQPRYVYRGEANGLQLEIALDQNGRVVSAFPLEGQPGTFINPEVPPGVGADKPLYVRPDPKTGNPGYWAAPRPDGTTAYFDESGAPISRPRDAPLVPVPPPGYDEEAEGS